MIVQWINLIAITVFVRPMNVTPMIIVETILKINTTVITISVKSVL